ncbi:MAG: response regulator [Myxococcales bacterium]|nr:response regulator [Myxococcales bacterium]
MSHPDAPSGAHDDLDRPHPSRYLFPMGVGPVDESSGATILLVEDSAVDRLLVEQTLVSSHLHFSVESTPDLRAAYDALDRRGYAAAVVDWTLPDGTAIDFLERVEALGLRLPIVVLTGYGDDDRARLALERGAQDYLVKGQHGPELLVRAIRYAIERKRADDFRARLLHADRLVSLGNLAAGISHELNNPMSWLLANMEFIEENLDELSRGLADQELPRTHNLIHDTNVLVSESFTGLRRIARTVRALKDYSRLTPDAVGLVDVNVVVNGSANMARPAVRHRAEFVMELDPDLPPRRRRRAAAGPSLHEPPIERRSSPRSGGGFRSRAHDPHPDPAPRPARDRERLRLRTRRAAQLARADLLALLHDEERGQGVGLGAPHLSRHPHPSRGTHRGRQIRPGRSRVPRDAPGDDRRPAPRGPRDQLEASPRGGGSDVSTGARHR